MWLGLGLEARRRRREMWHVGRARRRRRRRREMWHVEEEGDVACGEDHVGLGLGLEEEEGDVACGEDHVGLGLGLEEEEEGDVACGEDHVGLGLGLEEEEGDVACGEDHVGLGLGLEEEEEGDVACGEDHVGLGLEEEEEEGDVACGENHVDITFFFFQFMIYNLLGSERYDCMLYSSRERNHVPLLPILSSLTSLILSTGCRLVRTILDKSILWTISVTCLLKTFLQVVHVL